MLVIAIAVVSLLGGVLLAAPASYASTPPPTPAVSDQGGTIPAGAVVVQATLACSEFTGKVLKYAQDHRYCPTADKNGVVPQAVQTYNCGSSWVYVYNNGIRGKMWVSYGFNSTQGIVVFRNLTIGTSTGIGWGDGAAMWNSYYDTSRFVGYFGPGWQSATYSGAVTLVWGGWCTIPFITDSFYL